MEQIIVKTDNIFIVGMGSNTAEIIKLLQQTISNLEEETRTHIQSLYTKADILIKLNGVLALHKLKGSKEPKEINLKELQAAADDCNNVDCHNCALDNVVDSYGLFDYKSQPLLKEVIKRIELLQHGKFRSVTLSADILIGTIKAVIATESEWNKK